MLFACSNEADLEFVSNDQEIIGEDVLVLKSSAICDIRLESITSHDGYKTKTMANAYQGLITGYEQTILLYIYIGPFMK